MGRMLCVLGGGMVVGVAGWGGDVCWVGERWRKRISSTRDSRVVPYHSTNRARPSLASGCGMDPGISWAM